tara:strand:+ start:5840 stop:6196 length:357 start_codon:yes stop_codon:yes gene_type:complete
MRRSLYRPQNTVISSCGQQLCEDINSFFRRSGARSCKFDGFCGTNSAYLYMPGTCSMNSGTVESLSAIMFKHGVSKWDWQLSDNGVQLRYSLSDTTWWLGVIILAVLFYWLFLNFDVH